MTPITNAGTAKPSATVETRLTTAVVGSSRYSNRGARSVVVTRAFWKISGTTKARHVA